MKHKFTASKLRQLREMAGLSQAELARRMGTVSQAISNIERGVQSVPKKSLMALNKALNIDEKDTQLADAIIEDTKRQLYDHLRPCVPRQFPKHMINLQN